MLCVSCESCWVTPLVQKLQLQIFLRQALLYLGFLLRWLRNNILKLPSSLLIERIIEAQPFSLSRAFFCLICTPKHHLCCFWAPNKRFVIPLASSLDHVFQAVSWICSLLKDHPSPHFLEREKEIDIYIERERERERGRERERNNDLLFHLCMHSLVDTCMCPDQGLNLQPWCVWTVL